MKALTSQWEHLTFYTHFQGLRLEWSRRIKINPKSYMFLKHVPGTRNIFAVSAEEPKHHQIVKILYPEKLNFTSCKEFKWRWNQFCAFSIVHLWIFHFTNHSIFYQVMLITFCIWIAKAALPSQTYVSLFVHHQNPSNSSILHLSSFILQLLSFSACFFGKFNFSFGLELLFIEIMEVFD